MQSCMGSAVRPSHHTTPPRWRRLAVKQETKRKKLKDCCDQERTGFPERGGMGKEEGMLLGHLEEEELVRPFLRKEWH